MERTSSRVTRGGGRRLRVGSNGNTRKVVAPGERVRRRRRRRVVRGGRAGVEQGKERLHSGCLSSRSTSLVPVQKGGEEVVGASRVSRGRKGRYTLQEGTRRGIGGGRVARVGRKGKGREHRQRRVTEGYRRRLRRSRLGARVRIEVSDRRQRYMGRELRSLSTYVMVGHRRGSGYATEAGRKYYRVGARASSRRVRGMARVYGETGRVKREERSRRRGVSDSEGSVVSRGSQRRRVWVRRFKRGARPVHRWVADVYEGAPTRAGRYRRIVPKLARRVRRGRRRRTRKGGLRSAGERSGAPLAQQTIAAAAKQLQVGVGCRDWIRTEYKYQQASGSNLPLSIGLDSYGWSRTEVESRRRRSGRGSVRVGGRGRRVQRRWKRYIAYSGIGGVGHIRRGVRTRIEEGIKGIRWSMGAYVRGVRRRWGGRMGMGVGRKEHGRSERGKRGKRVGERKYVTERRGRGKENGTMAACRTRARMSRVGRPPRIGFGAKRSVYRARVGKGRGSGSGRYRVVGGRGLLLGIVAGYGYLRRVKRMRMEEWAPKRESLGSAQEQDLRRSTEGQVSDPLPGRRQRKVTKEMGRRRGRSTGRRRRGWRNGAGRERKRERRAREVRGRVK
jgi:hypothetical protein